MRFWNIFDANINDVIYTVIDSLQNPTVDRIPATRSRQRPSTMTQTGRRVIGPRRG
jgi:hypothetical protein